MSDKDLQTQIDELRAEIKQLRAELTGRLGPRQQTEEERQAQIDKFIEDVKVRGEL